VLLKKTLNKSVKFDYVCNCNISALQYIFLLSGINVCVQLNNICYLWFLFHLMAGVLKTYSYFSWCFIVIKICISLYGSIKHFNCGTFFRSLFPGKAVKVIAAHHNEVQNHELELFYFQPIVIECIMQNLIADLFIIHCKLCTGLYQHKHVFYQI
jgi:hypothetical protein